ncbi:MAG TPA: integrin alpha, partial [bacterium]|nr:integrin alpha [bacterium]
RTGSADWTWSWETVAWGREGALRPAGRSTRTAAGDRVDFRFADGLSEWWINRPDGLEQGFTVSTPPAGEGRLVVRGRGPTDLAAVSVEAGLEFRCPEAPADSEPLLVYDRLHAYDATGRELPSAMAWHDGTIEIAVDDADAVYPVDIDPLLTKHVTDPLGDPSFGAYHGFSVHTAGDVNGDGYSDFLIGAPGWDNGLAANAGRVFLYRGASIGIETTPVWDSQSIAALANYGHSVAAAGDVNGDGYDDVLVGAPLYDNGGGEEGRVYLYFGTSAQNGYLQGTPAWTSTGAFADTHYGASVAGAGDVNGDGYDDILIGAPDYEGITNPTNSGAFYLFLGSASGPAAAPDDAGFGTSGSQYLGYSVGAAGDVNADGYSDVIVGSPRARNSSNRVSGKVIVHYGSPGGFAASPDTLVGNQENAWFGASVHLAGDVDGDGYGEVVVGQPFFDGAAGTDCGRVALYAGGPGGIVTASVWDDEGTLDDAWLGWSVGCAGDVNADGHADFVAGAPAYGPSDEGRALLYRGSAFGWPSLTGYSFGSSPANNDQLGYCVATAGDVDGDGFSDLLVASPYWDDSFTDQGRVELWLGGTFQPTSLCTGRDGTTADPIGKSICIADVNGDGLDDWISPVGDGSLEVHTGTRDFIVPDPIVQIVSGPTGVGFGAAMANAGDVNGDGY